MLIYSGRIVFLNSIERSTKSRIATTLFSYDFSNIRSFWVNLTASGSVHGYDYLIYTLKLLHPTYWKLFFRDVISSLKDGIKIKQIKALSLWKKKLFLLVFIKQKNLIFLTKNTQMLTKNNYVIISFKVKYFS